MSRDEHREALLDFLRTIQRPGQPIEEADEGLNLISAGLADSLAILQIVSFLEENYAVDFADRGVDPDELSSIGGILDCIEQSGK